MPYKSKLFFNNNNYEQTWFRRIGWYLFLLYIEFSEDDDFVEEKPIEPRPYSTTHEDETIQVIKFLI